jgi:hypothetical protein
MLLLEENRQTKCHSLAMDSTVLFTTTTHIFPQYSSRHMTPFFHPPSRDGRGRRERFCSHGYGFGHGGNNNTYGPRILRDRTSLSISHNFSAPNFLCFTFHFNPYFAGQNSGGHAPLPL